MLLIKATNKKTGERDYWITDDTKHLMVRKADDRNCYWHFDSLSDFLKQWGDFEVLRELREGREISPLDSDS